MSRETPREGACGSRLSHHQFRVEGGRAFEGDPWYRLVRGADLGRAGILEHRPVFMPSLPLIFVRQPATTAGSWLP